MSFFNNLFANSAPAQSTAQAQTPAGATTPTPVPANGDAPSSAAATSVANTTQTGINPQNPLDWLMANADNNANGQTGQAPTLDIPQDTLAAVAKSIDFSKHIPQEALVALQGGDMSQLGVILNSALQAQYATIMQHSAAVTNKFVGDRVSYEGAQNQQLMRNNIVDSSLKIQSLHPVAQQMFRATAKQLATKFPDATPADIEEQTWGMMEQLGSQFNRTGQQQAAAIKASEVNWDEYGNFDSN